MSYFGRRYSLKYITEEFTTYHSLLSPLPFFSAWSTIFRAKFPEVVKSRKPHKFMRPFVGIIPKNVLLRERKALESRIDYLFPPPCKTHIEIPFVRSHIVHRLTQPTMQNRMRYLIHVAFRWFSDFQNLCGKKILKFRPFSWKILKKDPRQKIEFSSFFSISQHK